MKHGRQWQGFGAALGASLLLLGALQALAADPGAVGGQGNQPSAPVSTQEIDLAYQPLPGRVEGWRLRIASRSIPFPKEPPLAGRAVGRGIIESAFQGVSSSTTNNTVNLPFLWDYTTGKLYLDLNRNGDLAAAPVFSTPQPSPVALRRGQYFYQTFTNINLSYPPGWRPRLVDIHLYGYRGQNVLGGNLVWRCFWQGKLVEKGREWQIGLVENPNHIGTAEGGDLVLRPWSEREKPVNCQDGTLTGFECPANLFFQGRACHLEFDYVKGRVPGPRFRLRLVDVPLALGWLKIHGQYIERLMLHGTGSMSSWAAVLDSPEVETSLPVGNYSISGVYLRRGAAAACSGFRRAGQRRLSISAGRPASVRIGGPLTNWVAIQPQARALALDYKLMGADGAYTMLNYDWSKPPRFTVYRGGHQIGSGTFEHG